MFLISKERLVNYLKVNASTIVASNFMHVDNLVQWRAQGYYWGGMADIQWNIMRSRELGIGMFKQESKGIRH